MTTPVRATKCRLGLTLPSALRSVRRRPYVGPAARTIGTSASSSSTGSRSRIFSVRRLLGLGLASGVLGASIFVQDARAGAAAARLPATSTGVSTVGQDEQQRPKTPLRELVRTYVVFAFCSVPALVEWSPAILAAFSAVPGLRQVTEAVVRATFFDQFVGGDSAEDALPLIEGLRKQNTGCLFAYSVEVDEAEAAGHARGQPGHEKRVHKQVVEETLHCIDVAADFEDRYSGGRLRGRRTWVAIKLSAMVPDAESLRRFSKHLVDTRPPTSPPIAFPGCPLPTDLEVIASGETGGALTKDDIVALRELREDLVEICTRAKQRGVRLIFDAEYSWYQPAIIAFTLDMTRRFNALPTVPSRSWFSRGIKEKEEQPGVQPLIYATYQAYLRRTPEHLALSIAAARKGGYALGVKLVRGAYHPHELVAHSSTSATADASLASPNTSTSLSISPEPVPPVWTSKADTDARYNACVRALVAEVKEDVRQAGPGLRPPSIGVLFGTHNWESAGLIVEELVRQGLAVREEGGAVRVGDEVAERVTVGQLYGMTAALTGHLVNRIRSSSPFVIKYIPYGRLSEVMPYLSRRAIENKSVLGDGGAQEERRRAAAEIWARLFE
ncbi:FAD-linked oxidoreductase-like protein [Trametes polyzona]|nr:FAD-linked oxidoreductase-like protein [Trametes polyzona]